MRADEPPTLDISSSGTPTRSRARRRFISAALVALVALTILALFERNVRRWWFLNDDAFITFRYARNFVEGNGLVFNPGERVEGYTEFLFATLMAAAIRVGMRPEAVSNVVGLCCGTAILALVTLWGARRRGWRSPATWLAPLLLALHRVFTAWSTSGMGMQLFALLLLAGYLRYVRERGDASLSVAGSSLWLAFAALARPEGCLAIAIAAAFFALDVIRRRRALDRFVAWALPCALIVGTHFVWRRWYYGFWLPNTFYAKVPGLYVEQGVRWLALYLGDFPWHWLAPLLLLLLRWPRRFEHALFATWIGADVAYAVAIGGDWHEFRFLCPVLPFLALMFAEALARLAQLGASIPSAVGARLLATAAAVELVATTQLGSYRPEAQKVRDRVASVDAVAAFTRHRGREALRLRELVEAGKVPRTLRIATGAAGILPWYTDLYTVDVLGLNDTEIAHSPVKQRGVVGHERLATRELLVRRGVALFDAANNLFWRGPLDALPRQSASRVDPGAPLRCLRDGDRYLLFETTLSDVDFEATFGKLERVF
jgi:hypothetical protein